MALLIPPEEWGALPPRKQRQLSKSSVRGIAIHWVGVPVNGDSAAITKSIDRYHRETRGWWQIAYQATIGQDGRAFECRGFRNRSGANGSSLANRSHGALCLLVGPGQKPSEEMIHSTRNVIAAWRRVWPSALDIVGHRDIKPKTECPGDYIQTLIDDGVFDPGETMPGEAPSILPKSGYPVPSRLLRRGDTGDEVAWLQYHLNNHGANLKIDGIFGPRCRAAVIRYQSNNGLQVDGLAGSKTISSLIGAAIL